ncbi:MAG: hypothetical protein ABIK83_05320 [Candidatus Zixiibacteriota bacterium]
MRCLKLAATTLLVLLLAISAGCERKIVMNEDGGGGVTELQCFGCHTDQDLSLVEARAQWETSNHGIMETVDRGSSGSCRPCHSSEGFLENVTGEDFDGEAVSKIGCFTCHAPHTNETFALRTEEAVTLRNSATFDRGKGNLCARCHHSRQNVDTYVFDGVELSQHFGPHHSNQSDMLAGENAYEYEGVSYTNSPHTTFVVNACVDCHKADPVARYVGGHTFRMVYGEEDDEDINVDNACNVSGCHSDLEDYNRPATADFDWDDETEGVQDEIEGLLDSLKTLLINEGLLVYYEEDDAYEPPEDYIVSDADSAGAVFNYLYVHEDKSEGIHNTSYAVALLQSSINFIANGDPTEAPATPTGPPFAAIRSH